MVQTGHRLGPAIGPGDRRPARADRRACATRFSSPRRSTSPRCCSIVVIYKEPRDSRRAAHGARRPRGLLAPVAPARIRAGAVRDLRLADGRSQLRSGAAALCGPSRGRSERASRSSPASCFRWARSSAAFGSQLARAAAEDAAPPSGDRDRHVAAALALAIIVVAPSSGSSAPRCAVVGLSIGMATTTIYSVAGSVAAGRRARDRVRRDDDRFAARAGREPGRRRLHRRHPDCGSCSWPMCVADGWLSCWSGAACAPEPNVGTIPATRRSRIR